MKNNKIKNVPDGLENDNPVNIKQLNASESGVLRTLRQEIQSGDAILKTNLTNLINNNRSYYDELFEHYFDLLDPNQFLLDDNNKIHGMGEDFGNYRTLDFGKTLSLSQFNIKHGLQIGASSLHMSPDLVPLDYTFFIVFKHDTSFTKVRFCRTCTTCYC